MKTVLAWLLAAATATAQEPAPKPLRAESGRLVQIHAPAPARWLRCSPDFDCIPSESGKSAIFCAKLPAGTKAAQFWLWAVPEGAEPILFEITVGDEPPGPGPGPGPAPAPPKSPLAKELAALYAADPSPTKADDLAELAALFRAAPRFALDPETTTAGQLAESVRRAVQAKLGTDRLRSLRERIAREVAAGMPELPEAPLTDETRKAAAALYGRIAGALSEAAK